MRGPARLLVAFALSVSGATAEPVGESRVSLVPWKVVAPAAKIDAPLILFWIPASPEELRRSDLLVSHELTLYSARCVAMRVVRADDTARLAALDAFGDLPLVVLTDGKGRVLGRITVEDGRLPLSSVETLVRDALDQRSAAADAALDEARSRAEDNDRQGAIALYESVWKQRCVSPRQGRIAHRALRKLRKR